jgi:hypothetical protein
MFSKKTERAISEGRLQGDSVPRLRVESRGQRVFNRLEVGDDRGKRRRLAIGKQKVASQFPIFG